MRKAFPIAALLLAGLPSVASADTLIVPDTTARNISAYGTTAVWSRKAADGTYRLVARVNGSVGDLPVPSSRAPFDANVGPDSDGSRVAVYSRCGGTSSTAACDIWRFDFRNARESKVASISRAATSETAPSFYKGRLVFVRRGGTRLGLYLYRPGRGARRMTKRLATETTLEETRFASAHVTGGTTFIRLSNYSGDDVRIVARGSVNGAGEGDRFTSPIATRFNLYWLRSTPLNETAVIQRTGYNAHRTLTIRTATRSFDVAVDSFAGAPTIPELYIAPDGVRSLSPKLAFP